MFQLCLVILPDRPEAAAWIPVARRIFGVLGDSDCRTAYVVTGSALIARADPGRRRGEAGHLHRPGSRPRAQPRARAPAGARVPPPGHHGGREPPRAGIRRSGRRWPGRWRRPWPGRSRTSLRPEKPFRPRPPAGPPKTAGQSVRTRLRVVSRRTKYADRNGIGALDPLGSTEPLAAFCVPARGRFAVSVVRTVFSRTVFKNDRRRHLRAKGSPHLNLRAKISGVVILTVVAAGLIPAAIAQGSPLQDKQAQAQRLEAQIQANGSRIVTLSEKLNGARIRLEKAQAGIADSERRTAEAQAETDRIDHLLNARAAEIYKGAGSSNPLDGDRREQRHRACGALQVRVRRRGPRRLAPQPAAEGTRAPRRAEDAARAAEERRGRRAGRRRFRAPSAPILERTAERAQLPGEGSDPGSDPAGAQPPGRRIARAGRITGPSVRRRFERAPRLDPGELPERAGTEPAGPDRGGLRQARRSARATGTRPPARTPSTARVSPRRRGERPASASPTTPGPSTRRPSASARATCSRATWCSTARAARTTSRSTSAVGWSSRRPTRRPA